jgi:hypothetical protein
MSCITHASKIIRTPISFLLLSLFAAGCATVGVTSINNGRTSYNEAIHNTSLQQILLNLARVNLHELPLILDVSEVDAASVLEGTVTGGASGIGARPGTSGGTLAGTVGAISGAGVYEESPTIRYQPLLGQPLIAQVSTPVTGANFVNLFDSDWPIESLLTFSLDRMTAGYEDYYPALNAIADLDNYGAITLSSTGSQREQPTPVRVSRSAQNTTNIYIQQSAQASNKNAVTINFHDNALSLDHLSCDDPASRNMREEQRRSRAKSIVNALWNRLIHIYGKTHNTTFISLKTESGEANSSKTARPAEQDLHFHSALGILKHAAEAGSTPVGRFLPPDIVDKIFTAEWNSPGTVAAGCRGTFFLDLPVSCDETYSYDLGKKNACNRLVKEVRRQGANFGAFSSLHPDVASLSQAQKDDEFVLGRARAYLLVPVSDSPPANAFVTVNAGGHWFSILPDDVISQKNLALLAEFLTIQAVPPTSQPLTPSIPVSAK